MSQLVTRLLSTTIKRFGFRVSGRWGGFSGPGSEFRPLAARLCTKPKPSVIRFHAQAEATPRSPMRMSSQVRNKKKNGQAVATHAPVRSRTPVPPRTISARERTSDVFRTQPVDLAHSELALMVGTPRLRARESPWQVLRVFGHFSFDSPDFLDGRKLNRWAMIKFRTER
ncbi:hypothetical protein B0H16DRAFT_1688678 [Mycena metata]|uniref:Uncharacterized protein n=1 Tax=Mycena metata TaxID=1033252 RepID=A0AAD7NFQ9_9AGAR|nr:hypothetical protein B0H16DRAFT_1688678 [Mycena metata]